MGMIKYSFAKHVKCPQRTFLHFNSFFFFTDFDYEPIRIRQTANSLPLDNNELCKMLPIL